LPGSTGRVAMFQSGMKYAGMGTEETEKPLLTLGPCRVQPAG